MEQSSSNREGFIHPDIETWIPSDGENKIRVCPPTWEDATHFGSDVYVHYSIGADKNAFICANKQEGKACPVCEVRQELDAAGEVSTELYWKKRVVMYIIDRSAEEKGPLIWSAPWTIDRDISKGALDDDNSVIAVDSPSEGYDVTFERTPGTASAPPTYVSLKVARKSSPMLDSDEDIDKAMAFIMEHPIPSVIVTHDYEHVKKVFEGGPSGVRTEKDATPERTALKDEPASEAGSLPSWDEVHDMDETDLGSFAEEVGVDISKKEFADVAECADWICEAVGIEPEPEPEPPPKVKAGIKFSKPSIKKPSLQSDEKAGWQTKLAKLKKK